MSVFELYRRVMQDYQDFIHVLVITYRSPHRLVRIESAYYFVVHSCNAGNEAKSS